MILCSSKKNPVRIFQYSRNKFLAARTKYDLWRLERRVLKYFKSLNKFKHHGLPEQLIVSLTSYPDRFSTLHLTLKCLLSQTVKPDRLILWIAQTDMDKLPGTVTCLENYQLEIRFCEDIRSYKKIIPTLHMAQNAFIVTADDDLYYWPTWLEELVAEYNGNNREVLCHRAHKILLIDEKHLMPYSQWIYETAEKIASPFIFPTSGGGVLYPPDVFHTDVANRELFMNLCPNGDDIWLYWMFRLRGGTARKIGIKRQLTEWPGTQATALGPKNWLPDGNDLKIKVMIERYGFLC